MQCFPALADRHAKICGIVDTHSDLISPYGLILSNEAENKPNGVITLVAV